MQITLSTCFLVYEGSVIQVIACQLKLTQKLIVNFKDTSSHCCIKKMWITPSSQEVIKPQNVIVQQTHDADH